MIVLFFLHVGHDLWKPWDGIIHHFWERTAPNPSFKALVSSMNGFSKSAEGKYRCSHVLHFQILVGRKSLRAKIHFLSFQLAVITQQQVTQWFCHIGVTLDEATIEACSSKEASHFHHCHWWCHLCYALNVIGARHHSILGYLMT